VEAVRFFVAMGVLRGFYVIALLFAVLAFMLTSNWKLTLVVWAFLPFIAWRSTVMALALRPIWMRVQEGLARMTTVLQEA
jgi:ATP-binding cassette subfamily B protein